MEVHKVISDIEELSEYSVSKIIKSQDIEQVRKFKHEAVKKAQELIKDGKPIYDLEYFLEYEFLPTWEQQH